MMNLCDRKKKETGNETLHEKFLFREIKGKETDAVAEIERICFPPNEACSYEHMRDRVEGAPELFLVAVEKNSGKIAGFLNGLATKENEFRDEFFVDASLHDPEGENIMLLGLDVLPQYRGMGLAREIVYQYVCREKVRGRKHLYLTCLESKVKMYEKFGFEDLGLADSTWGGEQWHEMVCRIS